MAKSTNKKGKGTKPLTPKQKAKQAEIKRNEKNFKAFARRRQGVSANEIMREWRGQGKKIGNVRAKELVRDVRNLARNEKKVTRVPTKTADEVEKQYLSRYSYIVTFMVKSQDEVEEEMAITLSYPRKMRVRDVLYEAKARIALNAEGRYEFQPIWNSFRVAQLIINDKPMTAQEAREYKQKRRRR